MEKQFPERARAMRRTCLIAAALAVSSLLAASVGSGARLANSQTYTDPRGDAPAPAIDLTAIVASNNDAGTITFRITLDRTAPTPADSVDLYLDTDRNRANGERGSDFRISVQAGQATLRRPAAGEWFAIPSLSLRSSLVGNVLTVSVALREIERLPGLPNPGIDFYVATSSGTAAGDVAPNAAATGTTRYPYTVKIADKQAPTLKALPSAGKRGTIVKLKYTVTDSSGKTQERVTIYRALTVVGRVTTKLGPSQIGVTYYARWSAPRTLKAGLYRFCVRSTDLSGNQSKRSCAAVRLT